MRAANMVNEQRQKSEVINSSIVGLKDEAQPTRAEKGLKTMQISVETQKGVVLLSGFVDSAAQIARATEVAKGVEGVKSVKNSLVLKK